MRPLTLEDKIYACVHWKTFPPAGYNSTLTSTELKVSGELSETEFIRYQIWQRVCGLANMEPTKCLACPHIRIAEIRGGLPVLSTLDGSMSVPAVDIPTLEVRHR